MKRTTLLLLFFPLLLLLSSFNCQQVGTNPGVTVTIGAEALATGFAYTLPNVLTQKLINSALPDVVGTTREFLILQITYNISNLHIFNFEVGQLGLNIIDGGFEAQLSGVISNITFDWWYRDQSFIIVHVTDSGNGTLSFSGGTYDLKFEIENKNGQPFFDITTNSLTLHNFNLQLDGGADWFYDLFNFIITPVIKSTIESTIEDIVSTVFDDFNGLILNIPVNYPITNNILFNWALIDDFLTNDEGFGTFYSSGYFVPRNNFEATPPFPLQFIPNQVNTEQAQVVISEFTFNSLGWALYESGALNITIPFGTTNDWRVLLPAFYRAFPDDNVTISIVSQIYPAFNINSTGITLNIAPYMYWYAEDPVNGNRSEAFTLLLEIEASVNLYFNDTTQLLHGKVGVPTFQMTLYSSNIGSFSLFQLETAINTVIYVAILPTINGVLDAGIPVPTILGLTLKDPTIGFSEGYMYLTSDAQFAGLSNTGQEMKGSRYTFVPEAINPYL